MSTTLAVRSPVPGRVVGLAGVGDPVFAEAVVGPGTAVDPERGAGPTAPEASLMSAVSPIEGHVATLHPHAFVVVAPDGRGVLVHLGLDTVELKGEGFTVLVGRGDDVVAGQPLVRWDPPAIEAGGRSPVCPVVALDAAPERLTGVRTSGAVKEGDALFTWD